MADRKQYAYQLVGTPNQEQEAAAMEQSVAMSLNVHNRNVFLPAYVATQVPGVIAVVMMFVWTINYKGGFGWGEADPGHAFNWHPLLMTIGMVYLYGNGALIYRVFPPVSSSMKKMLKLCHAATMIVVFVLMVIALKAAFDSHDFKKDKEGNPAPIPNMYTLHSWVGLTAAILFGAQWLSGLLVFLFPIAGAKIRANLLPFHQYYGSAIFGLVIMASLMGILEKSIWSIGDYNTKSGEGILVNVMGMMILFFAMGVTFLLTKFETGKKNE